jgi:hypothetical protein
VQRHVQGQNISFIERMHTRQMPMGAEDAWFLDAALQTTPYITSDAVQTAVGIATTMTASGATGTQTFTILGFALFGMEYIGKVIRMAGGIGTITGVIDAFNVTVEITQALTDVAVDATPVYIWPQTYWEVWTPVTAISGLDHLEGQTVSILADGNVIAPQVVINGGVLLAQPATKVTIGLRYTAQLQTLYLDTGEPTVQGKRKTIPAMTARVDQTRGLKMGMTFDALTEFKDRDLSTIGQPIGLFTGDQRMLLEATWNTEGQMALQQDDPLPATVLGVIPEVAQGDTGK